MANDESFFSDGKREFIVEIFYKQTTFNFQFSTSKSLRAGIPHRIKKAGITSIFNPLCSIKRD
jgi:hypothetical protein